MTTPLDRISDLIETEGLEATFRAYYSVYRAVVLRNDDPEERGRIQISCPAVGHDPNTPVDVWVDSAVNNTGGGIGWFDPPLVGAVVRVAFDNGNAARPKAYWGGWHTASSGTAPVPSPFGYVDGKPQKRGYRSRAGHLLLFNDAPGEEAVTLVWHKITDGDPAVSDPDKAAADFAAGDKIAVLSFSEDAVQLADANGARVILNTKDKQVTIQDASGALFTMGDKAISLMDASNPASVITMDGAGQVSIMASKGITLNAPSINLKGSGVTLGDQAFLSVPIFEQLLIWANSHTHAAMGAAPAAPPLTPAAKAQAVKLK